MKNAVVDPLNWIEHELVGANMQIALERAGMTGIVAGAPYTGWWFPSSPASFGRSQNAAKQVRQRKKVRILSHIPPNFELKNGFGFCLQGFIAGASYGGLKTKKSLNECRCCRLTGGTNSRIPLRNQDLSIVGHVDPDAKI